MPDIFLSYSSEDRSRIKPMVAALEDLGWTVWWDRTILAGQDWEREIEAALTTARCVLVAWSQTSINSKWVRIEAHEANARGVLVPVLLDQLQLPLAFRLTQAANLANWQHDTTAPEFTELTKAITALAGPPVAAKAKIFESPAKPAINSVLRKLSVATGAVVVLAIIFFAVRNLKSSQMQKPSAQTFPSGETQTRLNPKDNLRYCWIRPGKFQMGCSPGDSECRNSENPPHEVTIAKGFWMGQTEVTQAAYRFVIAQKSAGGLTDDNLPVVQVSWNEAKSYCNAVGLRLPTEQEWEYSSRAGTKAARYGDLAKIAWYSENGSHPIAQKTPNAWGLYDTLGNVWEWADGLAPDTDDKILRGGSWDNSPVDVRVSLRFGGPSTFRNDDIGFRCAGDLP